MKKIFAALLTTVMMLSLFACGKKAKETTVPTTTEASQLTSQSAIDFSVVPDLPYIESLTVPYKAVLSPVLIDNILYMAVAKSDRIETDTNRLIAYDMKTGKEEILFTSKHDLANIQCIQSDGKWLVWADMQLYGGAADIYAMNLETKEISCVSKFSPEAPSFITPAYMDGTVYWIEEENLKCEGDNAVIGGSVYVYDCATKKKIKIADIQDIYLNNLRIAANDGKVVWFDSGAYYIYDVKTKKIDTIKSRQKDAMGIKYSDGYIISCETDDFKAQAVKKLVFINVKTQEYTDTAYGFQSFYVSKKFLAGSSGSLIYFFDKNGSELSEIKELTYSNAIDMTVSENGVFITVDENEGAKDKPPKLKNEVKLHIYRLGER